MSIPEQFTSHPEAILAENRGAPSTSWKHLIPAVAICLVLLRSRITNLLQPLPAYDFVTYWASGRLFLSKTDPYSARSISALEHAAGWHYTRPMILLDPPWALPFTGAMAILPFQSAHYAWLILSLVLEIISSIALWRYFGGERSKQWIAIAFVVTFLPAGAAEHMGQITPLMVTGLTAFLLLTRSNQDFIAGLSLITLGPKPHLFYLGELAILLWSVRTRRWRILLGALSSYLLFSAGAILFDHQAVRYFHQTTSEALDAVCGVGGALRLLFGVQHIWLQFLPTLIGIVWFAFYWRKHRCSWRWKDRLPALALASLVTAPYSWAHDYILAMPAFIALLVQLSRKRTDWLIPAASYLTVQIVIFTVTPQVVAADGPSLQPQAWMAALSLLWILLYWFGMQYATSAHPAAEDLSTQA